MTSGTELKDPKKTGTLAMCHAKVATYTVGTEMVGAQGTMELNLNLAGDLALTRRLPILERLVVQQQKQGSTVSSQILWWIPSAQSQRMSWVWNQGKYKTLRLR